MADDDSLITSAPSHASSTAHFYPFATSPDVIRSHEKDVYITGTLTNQVQTIARSLRGARFAHTHTEAIKNFTELVYLSLTTLLGNRTLGEEYCDIVQLEDDTLQLPSLARRAGYILSSILGPWALQRILPSLRRKLRTKLERSIARQQTKTQKQGQKPNKTLYFQTYILQHLDSLTSLSPIYALSLATFYFTGAYYHLSKRLWGLRYVFSKKVADSDQRIGYEVLGFLMVCQMMVQGILHIRQTIHSAETSQDRSSPSAASKSGTNPPTILNPPSSTTPTFSTDPDTPHYDLGTPSAETPSFSWIPSEQQRKCTLCLELFKDPSVTTCGHVFCWTCIRDWVKEKAECPLCRQSVIGSKVLPLRS